MTSALTSAGSGWSSRRHPQSIHCWKICAAPPKGSTLTAMADKHLQFLDIPRKDPDKLGLEVRTKQFRELYSQYSVEAAGQQAGRCISCGNPFCEWKCPVHNYIPNWLALVNDGKLFEAAELSHQTN